MSKKKAGLSGEGSLLVVEKYGDVRMALKGASIMYWAPRVVGV